MSIHDECQEWDLARNRTGYGIVSRYDGGSTLVHRRVWEEMYGAIPEGMCVCHRCDNPPCINIEHLFLGTHADNMADMASKGRAHGTPIPAKPGSAHHMAKLHESLLPEIRARHEAGETQRSIARSIGIHQSQISRILSGKAWVCS